MVLSKINKWLLFMGLSCLVINPSFILSSTSKDSSNKTPSTHMPYQGSGNHASGQTGGLGYRCGCGSSSNGNWALDWGVASGPGGSTIRFGSGAGQTPDAGGFGFGWSSSTSSGDTNSPSLVGDGGGSGNGINFQFGFSGGFEMSPGNTRLNDVRKIASKKDVHDKNNNYNKQHGRDGKS